MVSDAEKIAERFHDVASAMGVDSSELPSVPTLTEVFDELVRTEVLFAGPSLYAEP
jgi:hypothetical protein